MEIGVPYGKGEGKVQIKDHHLLGIVEPNQVEVKERSEVLSHAMEHPLGKGSFRDFLSDAGDVLFIVNDGTRPTPTAAVLETIYPQLKKVKARFIIATGIHRAPTDDEFDFIFGPLYPELKDRIHVHDSKKDDEMVSLGYSKQGTEMVVNRLGVEAEKIVVIGSVEPHYFGGYTGGRKSFLPGIASYKTIEQNHKYAVEPGPKALALDGNPVHEDMIDALKTIEDKDIFSIQVVLDSDRRIYAATAGDIHQSFYGAIERANEVFCVKVEEKADIVITVAPYPMDVDLYQSQKAIDNAKLALKEDGILVLVSKCRTGVGEKTFFDLLASAKSPNDALDSISGGYVLGYHKAAKLAEIALWAQMWAVTDLNDDDLRSVFMRPFNDLQKAIDKALEIKGPDAKVLFLMDGSITVPMIG
jgi:nickel-dependent lactate racemase